MRVWLYKGLWVITWKRLLLAVKILLHCVPVQGSGRCTDLMVMNTYCAGACQNCCDNKVQHFDDPVRAHARVCVFGFTKD